jgi:F420-dependent oxidoreductase-like protein
MDLDLLIVSQEGVTWSDWCSLATACERSGVPTLLAGDHYLSTTDELGRVAHDAWTVLAGLAARTSTLRLGTMVTPVTFRQPAVLANIVATVDHISGGRVELGLGSGWMEREHEAFGFPFPRPKVRQQMLAEQLEIVHRLWTEERVTFDGEHHALRNAPGRPAPVQSPHPPIIVGGQGTPATTLPAARFADEYNVAWVSHPGEFPATRQRVIESCRRVGRDPATMRFSIAMHGIVGETQDDAFDRARAVYDLRPRSLGFDDWLAATAAQRLFGSVDDVAAALRPYAEAGADRVMIMHSLHTDLDAIRLIGEHLAPRLARTAAA